MSNSLWNYADVSATENMSNLWWQHFVKFWKKFLVESYLKPKPKLMKKIQKTKTVSVSNYYCKKLNQVLSQSLEIFLTSSGVSNWIKTKYWGRHTINFVQNGNDVQCSSSSLLSQGTKNISKSSVLEVATTADFSSILKSHREESVLFFCVLFSCPYVSLHFFNKSILQAS